MDVSLVKALRSPAASMPASHCLAECLSNLIIQITSSCLASWAYLSSKEQFFEEILSQAYRPKLENASSRMHQTTDRFYLNFTMF